MLESSHVSRVNTLKTKIKKLAEEFNLNYESVLYKVSIISKEDFVKLLYLVLCPTKEYMKFGSTIEEREKNYNRFLSSKEFSELVKMPSGTVVVKEYSDEIMEKMKDKRIKKRFKKILDEIGLKESTQVGVITYPENEKEVQLVFDVILFHEWIHILLQSNNINFQMINKSYVDYDEGLTEYFYQFLSSENKDFEERIKARLEDVKNKSKGEKMDKYIENVFEKMLYWNKVLRNKKTPEERYRTIKGVMKRLEK